MASVPHKTGSEVLTFTYDPGNVSENTRFYDVLYGALESVGGKEKIECLRADSPAGPPPIITISVFISSTTHLVASGLCTRRNLLSSDTEIGRYRSL